MEPKDIVAFLYSESSRYFSMADAEEAKGPDNPHVEVQCSAAMALRQAAKDIESRITAEAPRPPDPGPR